MCVCLCACVRVCVCVCVQSCVKASNFVMELVRAEKARRKDADTNLLLRYLLKEEGRRQTQTDANRRKQTQTDTNCTSWFVNKMGRSDRGRMQRGGEEVS